MSKTVVATFRNHDNAVDAARRIKEKGLRTDDISIVTKDTQANNGDNTSSRTGGVSATMSKNTGNDNISDGVVAGSVLGGLAGLAIGAGTLMIPGFGIIAAAGPIAGLLSGAVTGGVVGGLVDLGIPESKSREYEADIKSGKTIFSMKTDDGKIDSVTAVLRESGADAVDAY